MYQLIDYFEDPCIEISATIIAIEDSLRSNGMSVLRPIPVIHTDSLGNKKCINYDFPYNTRIEKISDEHLYALEKYIRLRKKAYLRLSKEEHNRFLFRFNADSVIREIQHRQISGLI